MALELLDTKFAAAIRPDPTPPKPARLKPSTYLPRPTDRASPSRSGSRLYRDRACSPARRCRLCRDRVLWRPRRGQLSRDSRLVVRAGKGVGVMVDLSSPVDADEELSGGQGKRQSNSSQWQRRRLGGDEASSRAVTNRRSTAHLPIADLKPRESRGRWWPSKSDQPRPSPRLPPSPNSKHRSDAYQKEGALVTSQPKIGISSTKLRPTQNSSASRSPLATPIGTSS